MNNYLTEKEIEDLQDSKLQQDTPFAIYDVSYGMFSIARHYGGATFNDAHYTYFPEHDQLIRDDVLRWAKKYRKQSTSKKPKQIELSA